MGKRVERIIAWDPLREELTLPTNIRLESVINLMGESIAHGRWNPAKKQRIFESRVVGTQRLVRALAQAKPLPNVLVSASAVGYYGDGGKRELSERDPPGSDFLADVCRNWEQAAQSMREFGVRVVLLRCGIVIGRGGGALAQLLPMFRAGLGGRLGKGEQWVPWIHIDDLVAMIDWAIHEPAIDGPLNAVAPQCVTNRQWTQAIGAAVKRPTWMAVPKFALRVVLGEFADSLTSSQKVVPEVAQRLGFQFSYPTLQQALEEVVG
jgi:hypothetical protein